jgi:hypothetical protein
VKTDGATSLTRIRDRAYDVPMHPARVVDDWRPYDPILKRAQAGEGAAAVAT